MKYGRPAEDMGSYMDKFTIEAAYRKLSEEMRGLRLSRGEKINCIKDYANLGAAVTESLMRKGIKTRISIS